MSTSMPVLICPQTHTTTTDGIQCHHSSFGDVTLTPIITASSEHHFLRHWYPSPARSRHAMPRLSQKHASSRKLVVLISFAGLLAVGLVVNLLWASASSSSAFQYIVASSWQQQLQPPALTFDSVGSNVILGDNKVKKKNDVTERVLSATYTDLPAPQLQWEQMPSAPVPRLDGAAIQIKNLLYVFSGYGTIDYVHSHVDIFNFTDNTWGGRFDTPKEMAHSHLGMATDGRYIYIVNGQYGPQCRGPTTHTFVLDTETKQWKQMPPLPAPRYAPATQLWKGRLHVMGGSGVNRHTPQLEHWSIAVEDGEVLEKKWRPEVPIPHGGPHRACIVVRDRLMVIGGQEGDFMAKPGSPIFKCSRRQEVVYGDVYYLDDENKWKTLPPMPKPNSHIEFAWVVVNNSILISGGTIEKHPQTKKMILVGGLPLRSRYRDMVSDW